MDTPDWFCSESSPEEVQAQISSCVVLSTPGPHTFLLCVPVDQPAQNELQALVALEAVFGPEAVRMHTLVLFTYADRLRESGKAGKYGAEAYIADQRSDLLKLVEKCGDRFHVMERGGGGEERRSVAELLEKVEQTVREAGGGCYSCPAFQEAEDRVRQRQKEIARERKGGGEEERGRGGAGHFNVERRLLHPSMKPLREMEEEELKEDEIAEVRDEAERSVSTMKLESLPAFSPSDLSPSLMRSMWEMINSRAKTVPKLLADSSVWVGEGAKKVAASPVWGKMGTGAKGVSKLVVDNSVWEKLGAKKLMADSSAWVGSGAKMVAGSPMWEKVGAKQLSQSPVWGKVGSGAKSGAKMVADSSVWVGSGAKKVAQSPMWGKVGSGAKTGAKIVADSSMRVGAGIGAGAKKVAQSPVWGQMGSGAKAGAKMVAESSVWEKIRTGAKKVPKVVIGGALLGLVLGVFLGGVIGAAVGAATGSVVTEVGRRRFGKKTPGEEIDEAAKDAGKAVNEGVESLVKSGEKLLKTE